jgi:ATP-dependent Clp protease protease subunit
MNNDIYIIGEIGWDNNLASLIASVSESDKTKPLNVHIHSGGGSVYDGLAMYNYLKSLDQEVNTISSGLVASIASVIFLAGNRETRKINRTDNFLIHLPMGMEGGNAKDLEKVAEELRDIEAKLADIYTNETDLTTEEAMALMEDDKFLEVDFLKEKGFVSSIVEFKAVAKLNNYKQSDMNEKDSKGFLDKIDAMFAKYFPKKDPTNKIVTDATGVELDFTELEADATPAVGDTAMVDGVKAEGDYLMPSGETLKFTDGALMEIMPAEEGEEEAKEEDDTEALKSEIAELKEQLSTAAASIEEKDTMIASKDVDLTNVKKDLTDFKAELSSSFDYDGKKEKKEEGEVKINRLSSYKTKK